MTTYAQIQAREENEYLEPIINSDGSFFCCACLEDKPKDDQSRDPRYCLFCFDSLTFETSQLRKKEGKPFWVPRHSPLKSPLTPSNQNLGEKSVTPYPTRGVGSEKPKQLTLEGVLV